jgi:hypothetical protein
MSNLISLTSLLNGLMQLGISIRSMTIFLKGIKLCIRWWAQYVLRRHKTVNTYTLSLKQLKEKLLWRYTCRLKENIVTDLVNALPGNSSVNTVQQATVEEAVFSVDPTEAPIDWVNSDHIICLYSRSISIPRLCE